MGKWGTYSRRTSPGRPGLSPSPQTLWSFTSPTTSYRQLLSASVYFASRFTLSLPVFLTRVQFRVRRVGNPPGSLTIGFSSEVAGLPVWPPTPILSITPSLLPAVEGPYETDVPPVLLPAATPLWFTFNNPAVSAGNSIRIYYGLATAPPATTAAVAPTAGPFTPHAPPLVQAALVLSGTLA